MLDLIVQTLDDTVTTMTTVFLMLFLTGIMTEMGVFGRLSYLARPLASMSHLPAAAASTFVISLGSALAANTMIARMKDEGHLRSCFYKDTNTCGKYGICEITYSPIALASRFCASGIGTDDCRELV